MSPATYKQTQITLTAIVTFSSTLIGVCNCGVGGATTGCCRLLDNTESAGALKIISQREQELLSPLASILNNL